MQKRTRTRTPAPKRGADKTRQRINLEYRDITELKAYSFNPRDNAAAIDSVAKSIQTFGFLIPVVIDENDVLVAGHTRVAAAHVLGMMEVPVVKVSHLSEDEINAFRVIDNKVAELAKWDFDLLAGEIGKLQGSGLTLTDFGWTREELDCLAQITADDCLNVEGLVDLSAQERMRRMERRAPATARCVLGEVVFFVPQSEYRDWINGIRTLCDYNEQEIISELKRRLGMAAATN